VWGRPRPSSGVCVAIIRRPNVVLMVVVVSIWSTITITSGCKKLQEPAELQINDFCIRLIDPTPSDMMSSSLPIDFSQSMQTQKCKLENICRFVVVPPADCSHAVNTRSKNLHWSRPTACTYAYAIIYCASSDVVGRHRRVVVVVDMHAYVCI